MSGPIYLLSPTAREGTLPLPMITFRTVAEKIDFSCCDTLLFTSKQAVITADTIDSNWKKYPCIAIGPATKKQIEILGGEVIYFPKAYYAEALSEDIAAFFKERKLLYLRPREVSFDSKSALGKAGIVLHEQIIYETTCQTYADREKPEAGAIIIFTSPSTIYCFLENFGWHESYTAVVIGRATKVHLPKNANFVIADEPLITSCIEKARTI